MYSNKREASIRMEYQEDKKYQEDKEYDRQDEGGGLESGVKAARLHWQGGVMDNPPSPQD